MRLLIQVRGEGNQANKERKKRLQKTRHIYTSVKVGVWLLQRNKILRKLKRKNSPEICGWGAGWSVGCVAREGRRASGQRPETLECGIHTGPE